MKSRRYQVRSVELNFAGSAILTTYTPRITHYVRNTGFSDGKNQGIQTRTNFDMINSLLEDIKAS